MTWSSISFASSSLVCVSAILYCNKIASNSVEYFGMQQLPVSIAPPFECVVVHFDAKTNGKRESAIDGKRIREHAPTLPYLPNFEKLLTSKSQNHGWLHLVTCGIKICGMNEWRRQTTKPPKQYELIISMKRAELPRIQQNVPYFHTRNFSCCTIANSTNAIIQTKSNMQSIIIIIKLSSAQTISNA